ncbi:hypothetical protein DFA_03728 [Cavenderia fasciculata]|uniref:Uncharacterized protein n=1 Tax=Cavenderia fasciculata TaxID=261658 RepID=F4Q090_CACFS|nr:uncharacterized protein DFA_03728 [Cavenderia fasciculata]EGG18241.1 hypothetical protein DFA_03728 [Cavenderia fasciculata]|eukprot:XP_004357064.1 hypothetical protein DFA_03728 [Cavenderia fasciculata]
MYQSIQRFPLSEMIHWILKLVTFFCILLKRIKTLVYTSEAVVCIVKVGGESTQSVTSLPILTKCIEEFLNTKKREWNIELNVPEITSKLATNAFNPESIKSDACTPDLLVSIGIPAMIAAELKRFYSPAPESAPSTSTTTTTTTSPNEQYPSTIPNNQSASTTTTTSSTRGPQLTILRQPTVYAYSSPVPSPSSSETGHILGRSMVGTIMFPNIEHIKRVHTDDLKNYHFNKRKGKPDNVKLGNDIGNISFEGYNQNATIHKLKKVEGFN